MFSVVVLFLLVSSGVLRAAVVIVDPAVAQQLYHGPQGNLLTIQTIGIPTLPFVYLRPNVNFANTISDGHNSENESEVSDDGQYHENITDGSDDGQYHENQTEEQEQEATDEKYDNGQYHEDNSGAYNETVDQVNEGLYHETETEEKGDDGQYKEDETIEEHDDGQYHEYKTTERLDGEDDGHNNVNQGSETPSDENTHEHSQV